MIAHEVLKINNLPLYIVRKSEDFCHKRYFLCYVLRKKQRNERKKNFISYTEADIV